MNDDEKLVLTLTDDQIVTRRKALGLAVAAVGVTALVASPAWADSETGDSDGAAEEAEGEEAGDPHDEALELEDSSETQGESEDEQDIEEPDSDGA